MQMKNFSIVVTRIADAADKLLVVPFTGRLEFERRSHFTDSAFLALLEKLGFHPNDARTALERSRPAPRSFTLRLTLSDKQICYARSCFAKAS